MPGVPSGKACEACRKQKKKCDEKKPSCSRCTRLKISCVGSGQQRFKFKQEYASNKLQLQRVTQNEIVLAPPSNTRTVLAHALVNAIKPSTDLKFNLAWAYGDYLEEIPRRLGVNEALDAATDTIITAHASFCSQRVVSTQALTKYSRALKALRTCLDDPVKAICPETLCAVSLLLCCLTFIGTGGERWTGHAAGAAQILKARGALRPRDAFEQRLLRSLRGPILVEGLFNENIILTPQEWKELVENELDGSSDEGQMMRCLARVPNIVRRGKQAGFDPRLNVELREESRLQYETMKEVIFKFHERLTSFDTLASKKYPKVVMQRIQSHYQRSYAFGLAVTIMFSRLLSVFGLEDDMLGVESTCYAKAIITLAEQATWCRPLGAASMVFFLMVAWAGSVDESQKLLIELLLEDYRQDFPNQDLDDLPNKLEQMSNDMHLLTIS